MSLTPMLTVKDARSAARFYQKAFDATEKSRFEIPGGQFVIGMEVEGNEFYVVDENLAGYNASPTSLQGTSVRLNLIVPDPDEWMRRGVEAGGTEIFPVNDQPYGMRQGRLADPEGHHWLLGRSLD